MDWNLSGPGCGLVVGFCEHGDDPLGFIKCGEFHA